MKEREYIGKVKFFKITGSYANVLFRIDLHDFVRLLVERGYVQKTQLPPPRFRSIVGGSGVVAVKSPDVLVDVNTDSHQIGVTSDSPDLALREFKTIEAEVKERILSGLKPGYYEASAEVLVETGKNPVKVLRDVGSNRSLTEILELAGEDVSLYGIMLSRGRPDSTDWIHVEIMPYPITPEKTYYVSVIYRKPDLEKIERFAKNMVYNIVDLIEIIERLSKT